MGFIVGDDGPNGDGDGDGNGNGNGHGSRSDVGGAPATPSTTTEMNNDVENGHDKNSSPPPPTSTSTLRTKNSNMILSNAELIFENMTFIVGQGRGGSGDDNNEKAILKNVGAKVTSGRKYPTTVHRFFILLVIFFSLIPYNQSSSFLFCSFVLFRFLKK